MSVMAQHCPHRGADETSGTVPGTVQFPATRPGGVSAATGVGCGSVRQGLDRMPWGSLTHAYGVASDLPALLADLADPSGCAEACAELDMRIVHQGGIYPATVAAVPILIDYVPPRMRRPESRC